MPTGSNATASAPAGRILVAVPTWKDNDAVGTDTARLVEQLSMWGNEVAVHASSAAAIFADRVIGDVSSWVSDPGARLVFVNPSEWVNGEALVARFRGQRIMRFHGGPPLSIYRDLPGEYHKGLERFWAQTRRLASLFDLALPVSEYAATLLQDCGVPGQRIRVVPPFLRLDTLSTAVPDAALAVTLRGDGRCNLLTVARVALSKGQHHSIHVLDCYRRKYGNTLHFLVVGRAELDGHRDTLIQLSRRLAVDDAVHFVGGVDAGGLRACYEAADVFLCLSESDSFPLPILEAQHFGIPVIARGHMGIPETVGDGGILIDTLDYEAIADRVHQVLTDRSVRDSLVQRGRMNVERFRPEQVARQLCEALRDGHSGSPGPQQRVRSAVVYARAKVVRAARVANRLTRAVMRRGRRA